MKKIIFLLFLLPILASAQIPHIFNAYFEIGKVDVLTNDTIQIEMLKWGGMQTPQGVSSYDQTDIAAGFIVWYFCDRYTVVANNGTKLKMIPQETYDQPVEPGFRVWVVDEVASDGGNVVAPDAPVFEPHFYGTYLQASNCISAYYAKKGAWAAEEGLEYDGRNLRVLASSGLYVANDSVQIEPRGVQGYHISQMGATTGDGIIWNGTNWQPAAISGGSAPTYTVLDVGAVGDQNNWSPTSYTSLTRHLKMQPNSGVTTISGIVPLGSGNFQLVLENTGLYFAVLTNEDANSTAANRFALDAPFVVLRPGGTITLSYVTNRWKVLSNSQPRKTRYTNEVLALQRVTVNPTSFDYFVTSSAGGASSGAGAGSTMPVGYGNVTTSTSATGRFAYQCSVVPYFTDKGEASYFRAVVQPNSAAPDGTESYIVAVGYIGSVDLSTNPKTAAFVAGVSGSTYCGVTLSNTNWWCITYDGSGTAESFDTGIAPAYSSTVNSTNLRELTVSLTESGAKYWIDGTLQATHSTETVMNAVLIAGVSIDKTLGTTSRSCAVAEMQFYYNDNF